MSGDMNGNDLSLISPLGLTLRVQSFYTNDFIPIVILLIEAIVVVALALFVCSKRDSGEGVLPARKGRSRASRFLQGEFGLAWRLTRGGFIGWSLGMLLIGLSYGSVIKNIDQFISSNEMFSKLLNASGSGSVQDSYTAMVICIGAMLASVPIVLTVSKLRAEEKRGRLEQILSKSVSRFKLLGSYVVIAAGESIVLLVIQAIGYYIAAPSLGIGVLLGASFVYLPALLTMLGITALLVGFAPKLSSVIWAVFGYAFMVFYFGKLFDLPEWVFKISPFSNIPQLPEQAMAWLPLGLLTVVAAAFTALGIAGYRRRDVG
jgi:ABC-2 type transport system permease protein